MMPGRADRKAADEIKQGERAAMFRIKKGAGNGSEAGPEAEMPAVPAPPTPVEVEAPEPKPAARRVPQQPARSLPTAAQHLDLTRRPGELAGPVARSDLQLPAVREKTLLVGQDVEFSGEIKSCQKLIVEGIVQVSSANCRQLQVSATGVFNGCIEVSEAEVLGRFEGELIARERLIVRASGRVSGKIRYGSIIVDSGGHIAGDIGALDEEPKSVDPEASADEAARRSMRTTAPAVS
jgi:cytoskeletal protein CcmA (bactofilin family)